MAVATREGKTLVSAHPKPTDAEGFGWHPSVVELLLVEDDDGIADPLIEGLLREGFHVARAATGQEALAAPVPDVVLLDLRLPDMDGYDVCRKLRERSNVAVLMVTARGTELDRVLGLELGADDYIVKPFGFRELVARIRAVWRRSQESAPGNHAAEFPENFCRSRCSATLRSTAAPGECSWAARKWT